MTPVALAPLQPGEFLVRVLRGELTIPPDHTAIARANLALRNYGSPGSVAARSKDLNEAQRECLEGSHG